jgi:hypothetical protein
MEIHMTLRPQPPATLADDLREALGELDSSLGEASACLSYIEEDLLDSVRASRLARRRQSSVISDVAPVLQLFVWFLDEGLQQVEGLTEALAVLLEPPHTGRNYGRRYGVYVRTPLDWTRCGTPANYWAHRRRGQDACRACKKAVARYNADRRWRRKSLARSTVTITELGESPCP